jgi:type I restriction enzyme S subunit
MKLAEDLKKAVLQAAMQGKLTKQLKTDSSVDELLKKIAEEKAKLIAEGKIRKEKPLSEIQENEIPFEIPEKWRWVRLGSVFNIRSALRIHQTDWCKTGIPFFRGRDLVQLSKNGDVNPEVFISEELYKKNKEKAGVPQKDDILLSAVGSIGKTYIVKGTKPFYYKDAYILCLENYSKLNPQFIEFVINAPFTQKTINENSIATTVAQLTIIKANNLLIPLPPIEEQQRIVEKLNQILPLIDEYGKEEDELIALCQNFPEEMKKSVLQAAMQGKLTKQLETDSSVDELLKKIAEEKATLIAEGKIKKEKPLAEITEEEIPFDIPETWRWCRLGVIGTFLRGSGIKRTETVSEGFPCIRYGELYTTYRTSFSKIKSFVPKSIYEKAFKIEKDDICMALTGENKFDIALASVYQGDTPIAMGGDMTRFRIIFGNPLYFVYAINSPYGINCKQQLATGDIICHISNDKLANIPFPVPPIEEQQRIVEKLNTILPIIDSMAVYGTKKKAGRPKQEEALAFISSLLGTQKSTDSKPVSPEITELKAKAKEELPAIVKKYASLMGVNYNRITIRHQKTRWGSCTKTGNLSFNCLLMKMPENVRDYVIIHELAHRKELNHSTKFWAIIAEYCPWYKDAKQWLKDNGQGLLLL